MQSLKNPKHRNQSFADPLQKTDESSLSPSLQNLKYGSEDSEIQSKYASMTFGLFHLASDIREPVDCLIPFANQALSLYDKVYIVQAISSRTQLAEQLSAYGFLNFKPELTVWRSQDSRIIISGIQNSQALSLLKYDQGHEMREWGRSNTKQLVLFETSGFSMEVLESLAHLSHAFFAVCEETMVDIIEGYQMMKWVQLINPAFFGGIYLVLPERESQFEIYRDGLQAICKRHLCLPVQVHKLPLVVGNKAKMMPEQDFLESEALLKTDCATALLRQKIFFRFFGEL